jgi:hypothetical protein
MWSWTSTTSPATTKEISEQMREGAGTLDSERSYSLYR